MRPSRRLLAALLVLLAPLATFAQSEADEQALQAIDQCVARLDPVRDVGYERIAARCPDLAAQLERSGWSAWLPASWKDPRNDLSAGGLRELRRVVSRELAAQAVERAPRVEPLREILADLGDTARERSGFWARFKAWLRSLFERRDRDEGPGWLSRLIERVGLSQAVIEIVTYVALAMIVALAVVIVLNELRAAGFLRRKRAPSRGSAQEMADGRRIAWHDIERAALADKPSLLFDFIATRLTQLGRLPPPAALTAREVVRAAELPDDVDRSKLAELASTAERVRYADGPVSPEIVESAVEKGRELLTHIEAQGAEGARA
jgi:hypothetical protein